jgi:hypothetical protein
MVKDDLHSIFTIASEHQKTILLYCVVRMSDIGIKCVIKKSPEEIEKLVNVFIQSSKNIVEGIIHEENRETCMLSLIRDTYMCNILLRYIGLMIMVGSDLKVWEHTDKIITKYIKSYYKNSKFIVKITNLYNYYLQDYKSTEKNYDYCKFLDKIIQRSDIRNKSLKIHKKIEVIEGNIFDDLEINPNINIDRSLFADNNIFATTNATNVETQSSADIVSVALSIDNYKELIDKVTDTDLRHRINIVHKTRTDNVLKDFSKLVVLRQLFAESQNMTSFFYYINKNKRDVSQSLKEFLIEINNKLDTGIVKELTKIHNWCFSGDRNESKKLIHCDIERYVRSVKSMTTFQLNHVTTLLFSCIKRFFGADVVKISDTGWHDDVVVYNLVDSKNRNSRVIGRIFMDLVYRKEKKIHDPMCMKLSDRMQINKQNRSIPEVALLGNYSTNLTYDDVLKLFREFGYVMNGLCYDTRVGHVNHDVEFANFIPHFMEFIIKDTDTIRALTVGKHKVVRDQIEMANKADICYRTKLRCVNIMFDHLIHSSNSLINMCKQAIKDKGDASKEIYTIYKEGFKNLFNVVSNYIDIDSFGLEPITMVPEINGEQGLLYSNLMNEIFAYATFWIVKTMSSNGSDMFIDNFRKILMDNGVDNYRELIREFLKLADVDSFSLYTKNVIKCDTSQDYLTEDVSYFADNGGIDDDDDDNNDGDGDGDNDDDITINKFH